MPSDYEEQIKLLNSIIEQQEARISEQDATIKELRALVDELRSLKANLEETLKEFGRQLFGTKSEKTTREGRNPDDPENSSGEHPDAATAVKGHTRRRGKKSTREDLYAGLPVRDVVCPAAEEDCCGQAFL